MRDKDTVPLAEDDRAKIPFAVIGVLLLVTSVSIVVVLETRSEPAVDTDAAQSYDRTSSAVRSVVQGAATSALQQSAAQPVTDPNGSTSVGQALAAGPSGGSDPDEVFSRYVQLRVYLALQERLGDANQSIRQDTVTRVSMPEYDDPADAIDAITLQVGGDELDYGDPGGSDLPHGAVRVTVPDVRIEVVEDGFVVGNRTQDYTVTVGSSVFELHDRTANYEAALNTDLGDDSGFARHVAARLYRLGWQRGHAQARGAPVTEVLADRHVRTLANDAVFATQRDAFGARDPYANRTLARAYGCMLAEDHHGVYDDPTGGSPDLGPILDRADSPGFCAGSSTVYDELGGALQDPAAPDYAELAGENVFLEGTETVDLDETSETVVGDLETNGVVSDVIDRIYTVEVGVESTLTETVKPRAETVEPPGPGWSVDDTELLSVASFRIHEVDGVRVLEEDADGSDRNYYRYNVTYAADVNRQITWENGGRTRTAVGGAILLIHGTITVTGLHSPDADVDDLGIEHDYGPGPLDSDDSIYDTNYEGVPQDAVEAIFPGVDDVGAADRQLETALATNADRILGADDLVEAITVRGETTRVHPEPDDREALHGWLVQDLRALENDTSDVSVTARREEFLRNATLLEGLATRIATDDRVYEPVGGPRYSNVPDVTRSELRLEYMRALRDRVNATIRQHERQLDRRDDSIRAHTGAGLANATRTALETLDDPPHRPTPERHDHSLLETVEVVPDGEPTFLTFERVEAEQVPAVASPPDDFAPGAGRADNVFGAPATDVTTAPGEVHLRTAGELLEAGLVTDDVADDPDWDRGSTDALEGALRSDVDDVIDDAASSAATPFHHIGQREMRQAIRRELAARGPTATQAMVLSRGETGVDTIAENVARSFDRPDDPEYEYYGTDYYLHLETSIRYGLRDAVGDGILDGATARSAIDLRSEIRTELDDQNRAAIRERRRQASDDGLANGSETATTREWLSGSVDDPVPNRVPSGSVLVDRPAMNVVTTNHWNVHLRGEYARFVVRATPDSGVPGHRVEYVREGRTVALSYDGTEETAGRVEPLTFESSTTLLVAVPPDGLGVGDRTTETTWCSESYDVTGPVHDPSRFEPCASP